MAVDFSKEIQARFGTARTPTRNMLTEIAKLVGAAPKTSLRSKTVGRILGGTSAGKVAFAGSQYEPGTVLAEQAVIAADQGEVLRAKEKANKNIARILGTATTPFKYRPTGLVSGAGYNVRGY